MVVDRSQQNSTTLENTLGRKVSKTLRQPPSKIPLVLGDQRPCTADRGCRIVSVEIVVLLSTFD